MPFKSEAQRRFLYLKHPEIAKEFARHTPKGKHLPEHAAMANALAKHRKKKKK